jgi:glycerol-3-phosphate acyltransferase PlsY
MNREVFCGLPALVDALKITSIQITTGSQYFKNRNVTRLKTRDSASRLQCKFAPHKPVDSTEQRIKGKRIGYVIAIIAAYLIGSLPTGYLAGKAKGIDIRTVGSRNIGATNVFRTIGKGPGTIVLLVDALKGVAACLLVPVVLLKFFPEESKETLSLVSGIGAILGHNYTCWLKFKGGKGVATTGGVVFAWAPLAGATALVVWIVFVLATKYVSVASIAAAITLPIAAWAWRGNPSASVGYPVLVYALAALGALAIYKHKGNIQRLMNGTENRIGKKKT